METNAGDCQKLFLPILTLHLHWCRLGFHLFLTSFFRPMAYIVHDPPRPQIFFSHTLLPSMILSHLIILYVCISFFVTHLSLEIHLAGFCSLSQTVNILLNLQNVLQCSPRFLSPTSLNCSKFGNCDF